jgi:HSP20 family molecular chaperone IbpA
VLPRAARFGGGAAHPRRLAVFPDSPAFADRRVAAMRISWAAIDLRESAFMVSLANEQPFRGMSREMSKMIDQLQRGYFGFSPGETWQPAVNLYETETSYIVCVDLSGVDKDKIDIELLDQRLTIRGTRDVPTYDDATDCDKPGAPRPLKCRVHLMEIDHGTFARQVEVPVNVSRERITANYRNGMLWVELPKK